MPWKMSEGDNPAIETTDEGFPVWTFEDGKESGIDHESTLRTIAELKRENGERRTKSKELETLLKPIKDAGIEDIPKFMEDSSAAIKTVKDYGDKQLIDAGEAEKVKKGVEDAYLKKLDEQKSSYETALGERDVEVAKVNQSIRRLVIKGAFERSDFVREKTVLDPEIAYNTFGPCFDFEENHDGDLTPFAKHYISGEKVFSLKNPGTYARGDEAIELLVNSYPGKETILVGSEAGGGGAKKKGTDGGGKISAEELAKLPPGERMKYAFSQQGAK